MSRLSSNELFRRAGLCFLLLLGSVSAGCSLDTYDTGNEGHWDFPDAAMDAGEVDAAPDACVPADEVCDEQDNDCDGEIDEDFDLQTDSYNCGECGNVCEIDHAVTECVGGECRMSDCLPGHWDINGDPADGCEYSCHQTNNGEEVCDQVDNDCDGEIDEDFDLQNDPQNCGQCHRGCAFFQGVGACVGGQCELESCRGGYVDKDGDPDNGCECMMDIDEGAVECDEANPVDCDVATEVCADVDDDGVAHCASIPADGCDGVDNDCDGDVDEDAPSQLSGTDCFTHPVGCSCAEIQPGVFDCSCVGECSAGVPTCVGGEVICGGQQGPAAELCDDLDNDCNGETDEGFDKQNDPANCGGCGVQCSLQVPNAISGCTGGQCVVVACLPGYWDLDPNQPGCEYGCTLSNGGSEACGDSVDNDCDGETDEGFDFQSDSANCGSCGNDCGDGKPFGTEVASCTGGTCVYSCLGGHYDLNGDLSMGQSGNGCEYACADTNGGVEACDGLDNDCNGETDETFDKETDIANCGSCGHACVDDAGQNSVVVGCANGVCQFACAAGYVDLNGDVSLGFQGDGCEYGCADTNGGVEGCDGVDNDCDGDTDETPQGGTLTRSCYTGPGGTEGVGPCQGGTQTCVGGGWSTCEGETTPAAESCDGVDNDCDGDTDEDTSGVPLSQSCYTGPGGTEGVGVCQGGTQTCTGGGWGACQGETTPATETCDSVDNDCDSQTDEDYDTTSDLVNCGSCGYSCVDRAGAGSVATACTGGVCQYACQPNYYDLDGDVAAGDAGTGCEYSCTKSNNGVEACGDSIDNDCDGSTDEGFDFSSDMSNCGSCGYSCASHTPYGAVATACTSGVCQFACQADYHDLDGDLSSGDTGNGCEYTCATTNGGVEACDGSDNDCDGSIDEDFDKQTDVDNCGSCGYSCASHVGANSVVTGCSGGSCQFACGSGHVDLNGDVGLGDTGDGCEYGCAPTNGGVESCDGVDNDCDGDTDEDVNGNPLARSCYTGPGGTASVGPCREGTQTCSGGGWGACEGEVTPVAEACDNVDNDCDGSTDEDGTGSPLSQACYTGPAGTEGVGVCSGGTQSCSAGAWGACQGEQTPDLESCDSVDNDCDGSTDEDFDTATDMLNCGTCGYRCADHVGPSSYADSCSAGTCVYACQPNHYDLNGDVSAGDLGDGCEYSCSTTNGGVEACGDSIDNDCDGQTDEGFDLQNDVNNCGGCGYSCSAHTPFGAEVTGCSSGSCQFACLPGYHDLDGDLALGDSGTGCEYNCTVSNGGTEACDNLDNDCDGSIDEDFSKQTNPDHCGSCNHSCSAHTGANSTVTGCSGGVCQFDCLSGYHDLNGDVGQGDAGDGCEYVCTTSSGGVESCDGLDNDCDGSTDEDSSGVPLSRSCYTGAGGTEGVGICHGGTESCSSGGWSGVCEGEVTPQSELCDGLDNDCDSQTDEDFDTSTDLNNCGSCGNSCWASPPPSSYPDSCASGVCHYVCMVGYSDVNGDLNDPTSDGCEYTCPVSPPVDEYCDGVDNDCDGQTDEGLTPPSGYCNQGTDGPGPELPGSDQNNPCSGTTALCEDPDGAGALPHGWYCQYPSSVETDSTNPNLLLGYETLCDGADGDCDGYPDDGFGLGDDCDNGEIGGCKVSGTVICDGTDPTQTTCDLPDPSTWPIPEDELCDGTDNDCDGLTDENEWQNDPANDPGGVQAYVVDDVVMITTPTGVDVFVYEFEASRPTASFSEQGTGTEVRACSRPDVLPWSFLTWQQAQLACARAGMRLCYADEWYEACNGQSVSYVYPYGDAYSATACNGKDKDPAVDELDPTGTQIDCFSSGYLIEDMSGNLREWTDDYVGDTSGGKAIYRIRGGSYIDGEAGLACSFTTSAYVEDALASHLGFRCCSTCGNGTLDAGETCDPVIDADCNPIFCGPDTCGDSNLDAGEQCDDGNLLPLDGCSPQCQWE